MAARKIRSSSFGELYRLCEIARNANLNVLISKNVKFNLEAKPFPNVNLQFGQSQATPLFGEGFADGVARL
jgi:hypothetical protein